MIDINECSLEPCKHGTCIDRINGVECNCTGSGKCCSCFISNIYFVETVVISYKPLHATFFFHCCW